MPDTVLNGPSETDSRGGIPEGRCGKCGYPVHPGAGFVCSECGSDLRQAGIAIGQSRRGTVARRLVWFLIFAVPWGIVCLLMVALAWDLLAEHVWPYRITYQSIYRLYPTQIPSHYENIVLNQDVHGVMHGMRATGTPFKEMADTLTYEVTATLNSSDGATVLRVKPLSNMAWSYSQSTGAGKAGNTPLNKAAILDWLKASGQDISQRPVQRQAEELFFIFDGLKTELEAGYSYERLSSQTGISYWANGFDNGNPAMKGGSADGPPFNGVAQSTYMGPPIGPPPNAIPALASALLWVPGVWWWVRRMRKRATAATPDRYFPAAIPAVAAGSAEPSHRVLSILFSDVKDYTSHTATQSRAGVMDIVRAHRERVFPIVKKRHGQVVKQMGDGILCTFDSATDAVLAGLEIQNLSQAERTDAAKLEIRIAISTGEVTIEASDVFGGAVNLASRVQQIAPPGEVYLTETTFSLLNLMEVNAGDVGIFELKGVAQPVKVYRAIASPPAPH